MFINQFVAYQGVYVGYKIKSESVKKNISLRIERPLLL